VDRYGREIGRVIVDDGVDANLAQVQRGLAWHYKAYECEQSSVDRKAYSETESQAKAARLGLWADADPMHPPGPFAIRRSESSNPAAGMIGFSYCAKQLQSFQFLTHAFLTKINQPLRHHEYAYLLSTERKPSIHQARA
jgi:hypothetical protein